MPRDISASGCGNFTRKLYVIAVCGQEYHLVNVEGDVLRLGALPAGGDIRSAEKRPKNLGQPLVKHKYSISRRFSTNERQNAFALKKAVKRIFAD